VNELPYEVMEEMQTAKSLDAQVRPDVIDRLIELYCDWREECAVVHAAYERFSSAAADSRALAFAAYTAALDREAAASRSYEHQVHRLMPAVWWGPDAGGDAPKSPPFSE
jgi:hypothetical protein